MQRNLSIAVALAIAPIAVPFAPLRAQKTTPCSYRFEVQQVSIGDRQVTVETYRPDSPGPHALLLMITGSAGVFTLRDGGQPKPSNFGEDAFAADCSVVLMPHYFDAVGERSIVDRQRLRDLFPLFLRELTALLDIKLASREVHDQPLFLYGESYGGFLAVAIAGQDRRVTGVSVYGAGLPDGFAPAVPKLPPLLIQHGGDDAIVPPSDATLLRDFWSRAGATVRLTLYPGEGHYFSADSRTRLLAATRQWFAASTKNK